MGIFDSLYNPFGSAKKDPESIEEAIMQASGAYIGAQGLHEASKFVFDMPRAREEMESLRLRNALMRAQLKSLPYDTEDLQELQDEPSPSSHIAKILATRYLEGSTNPISKVGQYATRPSSGVAGFLAKFAR